MISLELSSIQHNRVESARLAQAMAEYESRGGNITQGSCFTGKPVPPKRRDWVDPETVLKRKPRPMSLAERQRLRQMAEAI
ncbi:hypothetical protein K5D32_02495 [Pseudomonas cichorii]|uniref:hypothetical protein n=1 Tax=Pseudomonas cichorii TaxID=36746 RepID=UPI001C89009A|nr:hypothetical protein [Pseudomonas cichorii]MBX8528512.1 hypothetical protein [Pseudomonas cichorii]